MVAKKRKKITLTEFRAWLEGVEELQPEDWHPDKEQWRLIRQKIDNIKEETKTVERVVEQPISSVPTAPPAVASRAAPPPPMQPSAFEQPTFTSPSNVEMTEAAKAALNGGVPSGMVPDADGKLKTPNIDTTSGDYNSGFE